MSGRDHDTATIFKPVLRSSTVTMEDIYRSFVVIGEQKVVSLLVIILAYLIGHTMYKIFFHPLANIPGPFWCKISGWPSFYAAITGQRHIWIWRNHQRYGDRFRYRPNGVLMSSPEAYYDIYNSKANVKKSNWYEVWPRNIDDHNFWNTTDKVLHGALRKPLNQVFSEKSLRAAEPFIVKHISRWIDLLSDGEDPRGWSCPKNMGGEWVDFLVFDILGDLCFGKDFNTKQPEDNPLREIPDTIGRYMQFMYPIAHSPFLDSWVWLKPRGLDRLIAALTPRPVQNYYNFLDKCVRERTEEEMCTSNSKKQDVRKDMFHFLFNAKESATEKTFSHAELLASANTLVTAGADTTSTALCGVLFHLSRHKDSYDKLAREIRETFSSSDKIRAGLTLSNCQYLQACILEGMRMAPSVPSELYREVLKGGYRVDNIWYPSGTLLGSPSYPLHYNQRTFEDPFEFRPERWIVNGEDRKTAAMVAKLKRTFTPFSIGPRSCPGKNLAMLEMSLTLSLLIWDTDFRRPSTDLERLDGLLRDYKNLYPVIDAFIAVRNGPILQFRRREWD